MTNFLMIQNAGVAPVEAYTLLGASGSRGDAGAIGKFGTGSKQAVTLCLRNDLEVRAYCGLEKLEFGYRSSEFDGRDVWPVTVSVGGRAHKDTGWTMEWGACDWTRIDMALREFVANAIDRSNRDGGYAAAIEKGDLVVKIVESKDVRAKAGYTRVFVEVDALVRDFVKELPKRFLHFSSTPLDSHVLPKTGRSISGSDRAMIYREGVFLRELEDSLYDYNLTADELEIDECRNSNEYSTKAAIARRIGKASADVLAPIFQFLGAGVKNLETTLDQHYVCPSWDTPSDEQKAAVQDAWQRCFGDSIMADGQARTSEYVARKGFRPMAIESEGWRGTLGRFGVKSHLSVLSASEQEGRTPTATTPAVVEALDRVWGWIEAAGMTKGKDKPKVACFKELTDAEASVMGYYEDGTVYLRDDLADNINKYSLKVLLEECVHYVTGSADLTRDFQNFAFDFAVEFLA
jgi:hypothetical protein